MVVEPSPFRFAISATFTAELLEPVIAFWSRALGSPFEVTFAPYNQLQQTLLDPQSQFASNSHGVNVLLARLEDLAQFDQAGSELQHLERNAFELVHLIHGARERMRVPIILILCPPSPAFLSEPARAHFAHHMARRMAGSLDETPGVQFMDYEELRNFYPVDSPHDPSAGSLARIPYTELYFCAMGTALVRGAHTLFMPPYKVIALDCDNTLWHGICGEDGPRGIVLDPPRRALQEFMLEQREAGMLLVMASKNNEQDVLDTFTRNPEMPLQLRHFTAWRLNWDSKPENLAALADELSLGLDSFLFVDDNPKECAEVEAGAPEVISLALPEDVSAIPHFLNHVWAFDHPVVTDEDRNRNVYYGQSQEFGREIRRATNLDEFIQTLDLKVRFQPLSDERLGRAAQLTQRTNQFNLTTIRRTESGLRGLVREEGYECATVDVSDRFGDYGLVGLLIFREQALALDVDTFLLSCRVLGRGVEHRMLSHLGAEAVRRGCSEVRLRLDVTKKNLPAREFLNSLEIGEQKETATGFVRCIPGALLPGLRWKPSAEAALHKPAPKPRVRSTAHKFVDYSRIANTLSTPIQIYDAMQRERRQGRPEAGHAGMSALERRLAEIWADLLQVPSVDLSDNFFDLGGHSLLAVLLILRVKEGFGVELPIDDVYSTTLTLGELAAKIEIYQLGAVSPEEYDALVSTIESLSDEEVRQLLAEEDAGR